MSRQRIVRRIAGLWIAAALALAAPAQGAFDDPLFIYTPVFGSKTGPPPTGSFNGPCGLAVDGSGNLYVSDYYHHTVDVFSSGLGYLTQLTGVDPVDGPCGLAVDGSGKLYVNSFHRSVLRYAPTSLPVTGATKYLGETQVDSEHPTGVAVNFTGTLYVNRRTSIAVYNPSGTLTEAIGAGGALTDAYGLAHSQFPATSGRLYVADAATDTVKVFDPATSTTTPAQTIAGPPGGFTSLDDSAIAVDRVTGDVYVADGTGSRLAERPESTIQVFDFAGSYKGHLKYKVIDAVPVGLAVDNSGSLGQGRVYVTSGNTDEASIYGYPPGAATTAPALPLAKSGQADAGEPQAAGASLGSETTGASQAPGAVPATHASARQKGDRARHRSKRRHRAGQRRLHPGRAGRR
jgi:DNA-binding beta-propeller fold protein YncE